MAKRQYVTFYLGEDLFGIDILLVREINKNLDITPVDHATEYVKGLQNLRGQIVTVLNLGVRLGLERRELKTESSYIVLKKTGEVEKMEADYELPNTCNDLVGLLVDKIGDVVEVDENMIEPVQSHGSGVSTQFLDGVIKLTDQLLVTLEVTEVLSLKKEEIAA